MNLKYIGIAYLVGPHLLEAMLSKPNRSTRTHKKEKPETSGLKKT